jgi:peptidoglycan hydrolase CwlO-like protein
VPEAISADTTTPRDVDAFKRSWHRKIDKLDKQIAKAQKSLSRASDEGKKNLTSQIDELKAQRDDLQQQVDEAGDKTAEEWNEFKQAVAQKYDTLESGIRDLFKH